MEDIELKNRKNQKIVGTLRKPSGVIKGTCVIQHGYGGDRNGKHILAIRNAFLDVGFQTFCFDTTNSYSESDGDFKNSTLGSHWEDFEDVSNWIQKQTWFVGPLAVSGHSMGGYSSARYSQEYPKKVAYLIPVSSVVSGKYMHESQKNKNIEKYIQWKKDGFRLDKSPSRPGLIKKSPWSMMEEALDHDLILKGGNVLSRTLLIVGSKDNGTTPHSIKKLRDSMINANVDYYEIEGGPHTYREKTHLQELQQSITNWMRKCLSV